MNEFNVLCVTPACARLIECEGQVIARCEIDALRSTYYTM